MPIQQIPTAGMVPSYTAGNTALSRFPGYHQSDDSYGQFMANQRLQMDKFGADQRAAKAQFGYDQALQGAELGNRTQIAGMQNRGETLRAQIAANASKFPAQLQQQRFNRLFPLLQGQMQGNWGMKVGGRSGPGPRIDTQRPIDDQMLQERINSMTAQNDQRAASQTQAAQQRLGGMGFSSQSPLLQDMAARFSAQAMGANTQGANDLRWNTAQGNAAHVLDAQKAAEQQHANRMQEDIERRRTWSGYRSSLLGALSALV